MLQLVNIKIYEQKRNPTNHWILCQSDEPVLDSVFLLDSNKKPKDIFRHLMSDTLYNYYYEYVYEEEFPRYFRMSVDILEKLPKNHICGYYHEFEVEYSGEIKIREYSEYMRN